MLLPSNSKRTLCMFLVTLVSVLCGCSGGAGSSGASGQTITVGASNVTLVIANTSLQLSGATTATATFKNADGSPASGIPVNFSTTLGTLTPPSGVVTSDVNGAAVVTLTAGTTSGQGQLTASATVNNAQVTTTALFSVNLPVLQLANLRFTNNSSASINYGSSQGITVQVLDASGNLYTAQPVDVVFNSPFASLKTSTINSPVATVNGVASTTYTALTAAGTDTITVSISGSSLTLPLTIIALNAGSISYVSALPTTIGLKGMGGLGIQETSVVTFKVSDTSGAPKANQAVNFSLNTTVGNLSLSAYSGSTGVDGTVSTIVQAGTVATPVRVTATTVVGNTTVSTQSDQLSVSTGIPSQNAMSLAVVTPNVEAYDRDGVSDVFTVFLADHFGNPVPDGTAVNFSAQTGQINPSCTTVNGRCNATWTSSGARIPDGRTAVLAYAIGEESYADPAGIGGVVESDVGACLAAGSLTTSVTCGQFTDTTQAWRDDAHTGVYAPPGTVPLPFPDFQGDLFIDFNGSGSVDRDGLFNGIYRITPVAGPKTKHVFMNHILVMSTSAAFINFQNASHGATNLVSGPGIFYVNVTDTNGNTMAAGTTIAVTVPFGTLTGQATYTVPLNLGTGVTLPYFIGASATPAAQTGVISVTVTSPSGLVTTGLLAVSGSF